MYKFLFLLILSGCVAATQTEMFFSPETTEILALGSSISETVVYKDDVVQIKTLGTRKNVLLLEINFLQGEKIISEVPSEKTVIYKDLFGSSLTIAWEYKNFSYFMLVKSVYSEADTFRERK